MHELAGGATLDRAEFLRKGCVEKSRQLKSVLLYLQILVWKFFNNRSSCLQIANSAFFATIFFSRFPFASHTADKVKEVLLVVYFVSFQIDNQLSVTIIEGLSITHAQQTNTGALYLAVFWACCSDLSILFKTITIWIGPDNWWSGERARWEHFTSLVLLLLLFTSLSMSYRWKQSKVKWSNLLFKHDKNWKLN